MPTRHLVSTKKPGLEFRILKSAPKEDGSFLVMLEGSHGVTFERTINQEILDKYGYRVEVREDPMPAAA